MKKYITLEISDKSHIIAHEMIGGGYKALATCRSRNQAERITNLLNGRVDESLEMVREFNDAFGIYCPEKVGVKIEKEVANILAGVGTELYNVGVMVHELAIDRGGDLCLLRVQLIVEELAEVVQALKSGDTVQVLHELADLRYVVDGTALAFGLGEVLVPAIREVHRANMSKLGADGKPIFNEAGRVVKSDQFKKADVSGLLK
jgi:NTP pyrophosphatase (non-canonical NTP hydrolase)